MKVRRPKFDFSKTPTHWASDPEFAQGYNAGSLWVPYLERFLNRIMAKAATELDPGASETPRLRDDIKMFIRQEATHYTNHAEFNAIMARDGYDIAPLERHFEEEFERLFNGKSLRFLCAYCEGFEALGPIAASVWLGGMEEDLKGADPQIVALWKWHLMEEYEHRSVCHDVFNALSGNYFLRVYGLFYQVVHLGRLTAKAKRVLLDKDREGMTPDEVKASRRRDRRAGRKQARRMMPRILLAALPFHSPRRTPEPLQWREIHAAFEPDGSVPAPTPG